MKTLRFQFVTYVLLALVTTTATGEQGQLGDAGFESELSESLWSARPRTFAIDTEVRRSGQGALRWSVEDAEQYDLASQRVELSLDYEYHLRGWIKTSQVLGDGASLAVEFFAEDHFLGGIYPPGINGTQDWTEVQTDSFVLPQEATHARIAAYARKGSAGEAWFDDLEIVKVADPAFRSVVTMPIYRGWIWEDGDRQVELVAALSADQPYTNGRAVLSVFNLEGQAVANASADITAGHTARLNLDANGWPEGDYVAEVRFVDSTGKPLYRKTHTLVVKPATDQPTVYIDDHRRLIVRGQPVFPIGVYARNGLPQTSLDLLSGTPFNMVMPYSEPNRDELDRAQAAGVMMMVSLKDYYSGYFRAPSDLVSIQDEAELIRPLVWEFRDHPALLGWYTNDEMTPQYIKQATAHHRWIVEDDPNHPTWTLLQRPHQVDQYLESFDIIGTDPYPLPAKPIRMVGEWTDRTADEVEHARPMWQVVQAFNWHNYPGTQDRPGGTPTIPQLRNMIWQTIASGGNGVVLYSLYDMIRAEDIDFDAYWPQVVDLASEVAEYAPLLLSTEPAPRVTADGLPTDTQWLSTRSVQLDGQTYLFAVNRSETIIGQATFTMSQAVNDVTVIDQDRQLSGDGHLFRDKLPPLAVHIYAINSTYPVLPAPQTRIDMPKLATAVVATATVFTGAINAQTIDFDSPPTAAITQLQSDYQFSFAGGTETVEVQNGDGFLRLGGNTADTPTATWKFAQPVHKGELKIVVGATSSAADGYARVMSGDIELFSLRLQSRDIIRVAADKTRTFTRKTNQELDVATLGSETSYNNRLVAEFMWDTTAQPAVFQYRLTQPDSKKSDPLSTDWVTSLSLPSASIPDRIVISTNRHDNDSRDIAIYEITLKHQVEAEPQ